MKLFGRKISQLTKIPSSVLYLLRVDGCSNTHLVCRHHFQAYSSSRLSGSCLANPSNQAGSFALRNSFTFQTKLLSTVAPTVLVQVVDPDKLGAEIQRSLDERRLGDAWNFYEQHFRVSGFPRKAILNQLLGTSAESLDIEWLGKAFGLVEQVCEAERQVLLLERDTLIYLSFSLAKAGSPVLAATILRKMVEADQYPPVTAWAATLAYISQTASGAYLAADLVEEIGYFFVESKIDPNKKRNVPVIAMKPNSTALNIALVACLLFGMTKKAENLLEMMARLEVKTDSDLLIVMANIYERNGRREDLKKLERHVNKFHNLNEIQFRQFQSCLLACHLKLGDLELASGMVLEMLRKAKSAWSTSAAASLVIDSVVNDSKSKFSPVLSLSPRHGSEDIDSAGNPMISFEDYSKDHKFIKVETEAKQVLGTMLAKLNTKFDILTSERGIIQPTEKIFVKLVRAFLEAGKTKDLAEFLIKVQRENSPVSNDDSVLTNVINTCISLGWLEKAHDLLDEMRTAGIRVSSSVYSSLLRAYCKAKRVGDAAALVRDAREEGIQLDSSTYRVLIESNILHQRTQDAVHLLREMREAKIPKTGHLEFEKLVMGCSEGGDAKLMGKLLEEIREGQRVDHGVHDWNNVIHFFTRKRMMKDAEKALRKMKCLGYTPNSQTFHSMVTGYAARGGCYTEVTELWEDMMSLASVSQIKFDLELLDSVLYIFVRGGFFDTANEVIKMMEKEKMSVDKYKYRTLVQRFHRKLCSGKASQTATESQITRRGEALAFKKWIGLSW